MKLALSVVHRDAPKKKNRTHAAPAKDKPLARQMRKLRRHYDRLSAMAARLQGRPVPKPGVALQIAMAALMKQENMTRRAAAVQLLRELSASKRGHGTGGDLRASELASDVAAGEWEA